MHVKSLTPMDSNGNLIVFISNLQLQWNPMDSNGLQWESHCLDFKSLNPMDSIGLQWPPLGISLYVDLARVVVP